MAALTEGNDHGRRARPPERQDRQRGQGAMRNLRCPAGQLRPLERWLPVPGWDGYEVSDAGRVRSLDRTLSNGLVAGGVELKRDRSRYPAVTLSDGFRRRKMRVHKLVKLAFTGPSRGRQVRHLDDNPQNCNLTNLKYGTRRDNEKDRKRNREKKREGGKEKEGTRKQFEIAGASRVAEAVSPCLERPGR